MAADTLKEGALGLADASKFGAAHIPKFAYADPAAGLDKATRAALGLAADFKVGALYAETIAQFDKLAAVDPVMQQLVRRDGAFALCRQVLDNVLTPPGIDPLLAEGSRRPIVPPTDAFADAAANGNNSPTGDEMSAATETSVGAWIAWERRYNPELVLLVSVLLLFATVILIVIALQAQTAPAPSQPDPAVTSPRHGSVSGGSQQPSCKYPQTESCSPTGGPTDDPGRPLPVDDKDPRLSR